MNLPSEGELRELHVRACVAYAARCAMRVRPLLGRAGDHPSAPEHRDTIDRAIGVASRYAENGDAAADEARAAREAAEAVATVAPSALAYEVAYAASYAAKAVQAVWDDEADVADAAADAAGAGARAVPRAAASWLDAIMLYGKAVGLDYQRLADTNGLPADALGSFLLSPLWPEGEPEWAAKLG